MAVTRRQPGMPTHLRIGTSPQPGRRPLSSRSGRLAGGTQLRAEQLADLEQVAGDALFLPGQSAEFALGRGLEPLDLVLSVGQELVGLRLGLGDDLVGVLLGDGNELLGLLACLAQGLLRLRVGPGGRCSAGMARCSASVTSVWVAARAAARRSASRLSASSRREASRVSNSASARAR